VRTIKKIEFFIELKDCVPEVDAQSYIIDIDRVLAAK
jgi:hypothetical protein